MPILVKDYTWTQTPKMIHIRISMNPGFREKVDLFTTDSYIKAFFSPFIFEVFLLHDVNSEKSKCIVKDDLIVLDLVKRDEIEWPSLEKELAKPDKMKLKREILEKCHEEAKQKSEENQIRKSQLDRFTVQQAMAIDSKHHELMDSRRDAERNKAMNALEEWRVKTDISCNRQRSSGVTITEVSDAEKVINTESTDFKSVATVHKGHVRSGVTITKLPSEDDSDTNDTNKITKSETESSQKPPKTPEDSKIPKSGNKMPPPRKPTKSPVKSEYVKKKKREVAKRVLPRLRETAQLEISHTPRTFPTPSRESAHEEEQTWLKNITQARRATGFVSEDLRPEEQDPQWCKAKGDEFFRGGNFLGAVSAYSHGIALSGALPSLFANRSATHFALGNFHKCMADCSTALELMKPACEGNRRSRAKCIARRAAALARCGRLGKAIDEMKAAAKLLPEDDSIKRDVADMERAWEQNPDSD